MYLIVLHHSILHGVLSVSTKIQLENPVNTAISFLLGMGGKIGVITFVLIIGYFMQSSQITIKKIFKLWIQIFYWSVVLYFTFTICKNKTFNIEDLVKTFFANYQLSVLVYDNTFFMYCLIPILNVVVKSVDNHKKIMYFYSNWYSTLLSIFEIYFWQYWLSSASFLLCLLSMRNY